MLSHTLSKEPIFWETMQQGIYCDGWITESNYSSKLFGFCTILKEYHQRPLFLLNMYCKCSCHWKIMVFMTWAELENKRPFYFQVLVIQRVMDFIEKNHLIPYSEYFVLKIMPKQLALKQMQCNATEGKSLRIKNKFSSIYIYCRNY